MHFPCTLAKIPVKRIYRFFHEKRDCPPSKATVSLFILFKKLFQNTQMQKLNLQK